MVLAPRVWHPSCCHRGQDQKGEPSYRSCCCSILLVLLLMLLLLLWAVLLWLVVVVVVVVDRSWNHVHAPPCAPKRPLAATLWCVPSWSTAAPGDWECFAGDACCQAACCPTVKGEKKRNGEREIRNKYIEDKRIFGKRSREEFSEISFQIEAGRVSKNSMRKDSEFRDLLEGSVEKALDVNP